ncbi:MAG: hypothetical protein PUF08_04340 [Clostridiales bacterium]|nr:hypothetical protein [Clostridiales bacterium]
MIYKSNSSLLSGAIDRYRTANYGEDMYDYYIKPTLYCDVCGCNIERDTVDQKLYNYDGVGCCKECFKDKLFEDYAEDYEESVVYDDDEW